MAAETEVWGPKQHMRNKGMWMGSKCMSSGEFYMINQDCIVSRSAVFSSGAAKTFDEVIVNAADQTTRNAGVTYIAINFEGGNLTVQNDGRGIPIYQAEILYDINNSIVGVQNVSDPSDPLKVNSAIVRNPANIRWNPQIICEQPLSGTNLSKRKFHITGGVNGAGLKIVNYLSRYFTIVTVDTVRRLKYVQQFENGSDVIHPPIITPISASEPGSTTISFQLDYQFLVADHPEQREAIVSPEHFAILTEFIRLRAYQLAAYCRGVKIYFQGQQIKVNDLSSIGVMFAPTIINHHGEGKKNAAGTGASAATEAVVKDYIKPYYYTTLPGPKLDVPEYDTVKLLTWQVCVGPSISEHFEHMSIINGIDIADGGTHIEFLFRQISSYFRQKLASYCTKELITEKKMMNRIRESIFILVCGGLNEPNFVSQTKNKISNKDNDYCTYVFNDSQLDAMWKKFGYIVEANILGDSAETEKKTVQRKKLDIDKCVEAKYAADKRYAQNCYLFIPEGDSAKGMIHRVLTNAKFANKFTYDFFGWFNIGGVPANARKHIHMKVDPRTKQTKIVRSQMLKDNKRLKDLCDILGLDYTKKYESAEEMATLRYGGVIIAVDQDEDGKGNICSLLLNFFILFWPALIKRGFVKRLNTPIIRVARVHGGEVLSFYSIGSYKEWRSTMSDEGFGRQYKVEYYKGLATHSPAEHLDIFDNFEQNLITYVWDQNCERIFEAFFGHDTDVRKTILREPVVGECKDQSLVECTDHLIHDTKEFQRYNVDRTLPNVMDGLIISWRKALAAGIRRWRNSREQVKVIVFVGDVMSNMNYHHGDGSMTGCIQNMGQEFFPKQLPLFNGSSISDYGTRAANGNDAGAGRYIKVVLNKKLTDILFNEADVQLLQYEFEEGKRCEPKWFCPIIPLALCESTSMPAHGWKILKWARDLKSVFANIRGMITGTITTPNYMPVSTFDWHGSVEHRNGKLWSVGKYIYDEAANTITITELPHGISSYQFTYGRKLSKTQKDELKKADSAKGKGKSKVNTTDLFKAATEAAKTPKKTINTDDIFKLHVSGDTLTKVISTISAANKIDVNDPSYGNEIAEFINQVDSLPRSEVKQMAIASGVPIKYKELVNGPEVSDRSSDKQIRIIVPLKPDAMKTIRANYSGGLFDPVIEYFKLRAVLHDNLNFLGTDGRICELKNYEEVFMMWYNVRKGMYGERIDRQIIIKQLQLYYLQLVIRFGDVREQIGLTKSDIPVEQSDKILADNQFPKINKSIIMNADFLPTKVIQYEALQNPETISYDYLYGLTGYEFHEKESRSRRNKAANLEKELAELMKPSPYFKGANVWLSELDELEKVIDRARVEGWGYDLPKQKFTDRIRADRKTST